jgi:putative intracellular protease/amidase
MWDFPDNREIQRVTSAVFENGGIVGAVCHGPSALINVKLTDNRYLVQDKKINSFTDAEEKEVKKDKIVPFMLETRLKERGARFEAGENWTDKVVTDGRLITGQNPQSASSLARAIIRTYEELQIEAAFRESTPDKTASSSL